MIKNIIFDFGNVLGWTLADYTTKTYVTDPEEQKLIRKIVFDPQDWDLLNRGKMTDEDDWQAVLHIAVFIRAQAPDSELDMWMESTIFPALNDIPALSGLIDTLIPLGFNYQRDNEMATWAMAEITYQITYTN